jgi:hypothetical protein
VDLPVAGSSAGFWEPVEPSPLDAPPAFLADAIDPSTGELLSLTSGADPTDAAVLVALRTVRGSGIAVTTTGQQFARAQLLTTDLRAFLLEEVAYALRHLVDAAQVRLEDVRIDTGDDWAEAFVVYTNLAQRREVSVPIRAQSLRRAA